MRVNEKKSIRIKNRTKYFDSSVSKTHVTFSSPNSYQSRKIKVEGYESRLYWQFRYCDEHNGQTYFYTLTYNDEHMPTYFGENCFDYEDLRDLFTGGFRKQLLRKYGTTFKYFVGAELGDGKGSRGMHNNPHYHVLFFLEDAHNERFPYKKILPEQFRYLVKKYWQGFDENVDGFHDYKDARYGIAKEGENFGLVTDFRACMYCAKYVCKDVKLKQYEGKVARQLKLNYKKDIQYDDAFCRDFIHDVLYPMYNIPLDAKHTEWYYNEEEFIHHLLGESYQLELYPEWLSESGKEEIHYYQVVQDILESDSSLWNYYADYRRRCVEDKIREGINEFRNRYCNKCRISHGVGDYALEFMDLENPCVQVPCKKGFKNRPLSMYYYRKLFTDVFIDKKGSPIRYLNDLGREFKKNRLDKQIKKKILSAQGDYDIIISNADLFNKMKESDINTQVFFTHADFLRDMKYLLKENNLDNILQRYAEYKLVYEDRFFQVKDYGDSQYGYFPDINVMADYDRFLRPTCFSVRRSDIRLDTFLARSPEDWISYYAHPYFLRYVRLFAVLDMCADYWFVQGDDKAQREAEEAAATKRFHDREKLKEFYAHFGIN